MMQHEVRAHKSTENLPREEQLAWKIAQVAVDPVEVDADVVEMIGNRIIDNASVAIASLNRPPVVSAREQAQRHPFEPGSAVFGITDRVSPGVVYTTFHHPNTQANVITTDFSDWATNCPEYKVTAVQVSPSNGPSEWQVEYDELARQSRRISGKLEAAE